MGHTEAHHSANKAERKRRRLAAEEEREVTTRAFGAYKLPLDMVTSFRYLVQVILAADDDCIALLKYLSRARVAWRRMTRILRREGAAPRVSGFFFKSVV